MIYKFEKLKCIRYNFTIHKSHKHFNIFKKRIAQRPTVYAVLVILLRTKHTRAYTLAFEAFRVGG